MRWPLMLKRTHEDVVAAYEARLDSAIRAILNPVTNKEAKDATASIR